MAAAAATAASAAKQQHISNSSGSNDRTRVVAEIRQLHWLGKSTLQNLSIVTTAVSRCELPICVNLCFQVAKSLKKLICTESNISSRIAQVLFFYFLTFDHFQCKLLVYLCEYLVNGER